MVHGQLLWLYKTFNADFHSDNVKRKAIKRAIAAPRNNAKSTICSTMLPVWLFAYDKKKFVVLLSSDLEKGKGCKRNPKLFSFSG